MRAQRRRFVVEVKRGTNRASFVSADSAADKFSNAEDALFGPRPVPAPVEQPVARQPVSMPAGDVTPAGKGRVLRDLNEPPPPPVPDLPAPARRGRKPGSKNKPKPVLAGFPDRPAPETVRPLWADAVADPASGLATADLLSTETDAGDAAADVPAGASAEAVAPSRRQRLRDRSRILKRYVLGTEPTPGQPGWMRGLRARRDG